MRANAWGFYDMHGNVWEWFGDVGDAKAYSKRSKGWVVEEWTVGLAGPDVKYARADDKLKKPPAARHARRFVDFKGNCLVSSDILLILFILSKKVWVRVLVT